MPEEVKAAVIEHTLTVKVTAPFEMRRERVAEMVQKLLEVGEADLLRSVDTGFDGPDALDAAALGAVKVQAGVGEPKYAGTSWSVGDVQTKAQEKGITLTDEEADEFLSNNASQIVSDMVERGWASIDTLLDYERYERADTDLEGPADVG